MTTEQATQLRCLEGRHVSVALQGGGRIDDSQLVSAGHHNGVWLFSNGADLFVSLGDVVAVWETLAVAGSHAA
ncbi:MAG: hypothetical protein M3357_03095 [Actinomycetota bacterium]|nr:hypothetical protein [Actinomycetota bacterium]